MGIDAVHMLTMVHDGDEIYSKFGQRDGGHNFDVRAPKVAQKN